MKLPIKQITPCLLTACLILTASCSSTAPPQGTEETSILLEDPNGATVVDTITVTGTVKSLDADSRKFTLQFPDGVTHSYHAPADAVNFDRVKVGDIVKAAVTEEFAVTLQKVGTPASVGVVSAVSVAPKGAMPGGLVADTLEVTATVTAVNTQSRNITLQFADGSTRKIRVGRLVNLNAVKPGDSVQTVMSESLALSVEAP
jgi:hypothetical protein